MKKHVEDGRLYAAVCAAPAAVLGPWGLLKGLKVKLVGLMLLVFQNTSFGVLMMVMDV